MDLENVTTLPVSSGTGIFSFVCVEVLVCQWLVLE